MTYRIDDLEVPAGDPFRYDSLERRPLVEFLSGLIKRLNGPFVIALDSPWGSGKTTLVRMLMEDLTRRHTATDNVAGDPTTANNVPGLVPAKGDD